MKRYLTAVVPGSEIEGGGVNIGMCLEGDDEDVLFERCLRIIKQQPAACWSITDQSPFGNGR